MIQPLIIMSNVLDKFSRGGGVQGPFPLGKFRRDEGQADGSKAGHWLRNIELMTRF